MTIKIIKTKISYLEQQVNALMFLPSPTKAPSKTLGAFTHGYTSHKASILSWCTRLAEEGMASVLFDQPGHYLGSYNEVNSFETYKTEVPKLFKKAIDLLVHTIEQQDQDLFKLIENDDFKLVLGGHSLGALMSLISLEDATFDKYDSRCICVGLGMPPEGVTHIFDTPFYQATLNVRRQLVSDAISPEVIFPWIKERKENLTLENKKIHFITGLDDVVVGKNGSEIMRDNLLDLNEVTLDRPNKIPHHMPELAAPHIKKYLKDESFL